MQPTASLPMNLYLSATAPHSFLTSLLMPLTMDGGLFDTGGSQGGIIPLQNRQKWIR